MKQTITEASIIALEAQLRTYSQPENGDVKLKGETCETFLWGEPDRILQEFSRQCMATARNPADS